MTTAILWPTFALVALIFAVWVTLCIQRVGYLRRSPPAGVSFTSGDAARRYFEPVALPSDNLVNLFEMPVLYFALVPLLLITHHAGHVEVALAWAFVALRALHSVIHIAVKRIPLRFLAYLASCIVLSAMWIGFAIDMAAAS